MRTLSVALGILLLSTTQASARFLCEFPLKGKHACTAIIDASCSEPGKPVAPGLRACTGFDVYCDGKRLTDTSPGRCTSTIQIGTSGGEYFTLMQWTDSRGSDCSFPAVRTDGPGSELPQEFLARLYLSEHFFIFGRCERGPERTTPPEAP